LLLSVVRLREKLLFGLPTSCCERPDRKLTSVLPRLPPVDREAGEGVGRLRGGVELSCTL
jgi:hypothetical protein